MSGDVPSTMPHQAAQLIFSACTLAPSTSRKPVAGTVAGQACGTVTVETCHGGDLVFETPPLLADLAVAIRADRVA